MERSRSRAVVATLALSALMLIAACGPGAATRAPSAPAETMMAHSPMPAETMMAHSPMPAETMMEHSPMPAETMMEHSPSP